MTAQRPDKSGERDRKPGRGGRQGEGGPQGKRSPQAEPGKEHEWLRHQRREDRPDELPRVSHKRSAVKSEE